MKLGDLGEDRLLDLLLPRLSLKNAVVVGPGDDCAVVEMHDRRKLLVLKTDCVVEGVHFLQGTNALDVGWKAMMRPLSDFAATSAVPQFALVTLMAPEQTEVAWVKGLYRGLRRAAKLFEVGIVGGETSSTSGPIAISTSVVGFVERDRCVSRRGGKAGDGLGADLPRLVRASKVGFKIEMEKLPLTRGVKINDAISEGEDYELLFAISRRDRIRLQQRWAKKFPNLPLTRIGSLSQLSAKHDQLLPRGYAHFQQSS